MRDSHNAAKYPGRPDKGPVPADTLARELYSDLLIKCIANTIYGDGNALTRDHLDKPGPFDPEMRANGGDWPVVAHSMAGVARLENVRALLETVIKDRIPGDLIETGVWRGGICILMRGILKVHGITDRIVFVADSFQGLPIPNAEQFPADADQDAHLVEFLKVSRAEVAENFQRYGLLDGQVVFLEGWFKDTLPGMPSSALALMRLDGDYYESTIQALDALYPKLSFGGFVIVDDYNGWPNCKQAVDDYRGKYNITSPIREIDWTGIFWRKTDY